MKYEVNNEFYEVIIEKKSNKNLYIRVKEDLKIYVSANYFVTKKQIKEVLDNNYNYLQKMIDKRKMQQEKEKHIYYLGKQYDLVLSNLFKNVELENNKIYAKDEKTFQKWYKNQIRNIFNKRYTYICDLFEEKSVYPDLKIRSMKTRWGVCNIRSKTITLNARLIEYSLEALDYVIVHELSHLVHFNHSASFWNLVSKYIPNYKCIRKYLKE